MEGQHSKFYYVYMLQSLKDETHFYVGFTEDLKDRLNRHNHGLVQATKAFRPLRIQTCVAFDNLSKALQFECYLKSHSGRAFASKHF